MFMRRNQLLVAASVLLQPIFAEKLAFDADGKPYPEHANIIGWYDDADKPDNELKHFWMDQAQRMAKKFSYMPRR